MNFCVSEGIPLGAELNKLVAYPSACPKSYTWLDKRKAIMQDSENAFYTTNALFSIGPDSAERPSALVQWNHSLDFQKVF